MEKTWRYPLPVHRFRGILRSLITIQRDPAHSYEAQSFLNKFLTNEQHIFKTQNQRAIGDESKTR